MTPPRKRFGQHFLAPQWAQRLVDAIAPAGDDVFLEIGPGRGALTRPLAARVASVVAVEIDRDLAADLPAVVPSNVSVVTGDFLEMDVAALVRDRAPEGGLRVAGNLPYNISSPILFALLRAHVDTGKLRDATLMLQREVVDRLAAAPGTREYGVLTVMARLHAEVERVLDLPPGAFRPVPKVWSTVARVRFTPPAVRVGSPAGFERFVKGIFSHRRKTIQNALKPLCADPAAPARALAAEGIDPKRRPETLDLPELAALSELLGFSGPRAVL